MNAMLLRKGRQQLAFDFGLPKQADITETRWRDAEEGERRSRARFAQNIFKPEEVAPEWQRWRNLLGKPEEIRHFVERAMSRLDTPLQPVKANLVRAHLDALPAAVRERMEARGLEGTISISFDPPAAQAAQLITRSHPLPATLAEALLESALDPASAPVPPMGRLGAWPTDAVSVVTTVLLLRFRFKLAIRARRERLLLVEEAGALAFDVNQDSPVAEGNVALEFLSSEAIGDLVAPAKKRLLVQARDRLLNSHSPRIEAYAMQRASELEHDHSRVRAAGINVSRVTVEPILPADVIGFYLLLPAT
jgi:hypothetical protein